VSLTFWALLLMVPLEYVVFVLRANNDGEGCDFMGSNGGQRTPCAMTISRLADDQRPALVSGMQSSRWSQSLENSTSARARAVHWKCLPPTDLA
jgi:K+ potassium transporter